MWGVLNTESAAVTERSENGTHNTESLTLLTKAYYKSNECEVTDLMIDCSVIRSLKAFLYYQRSTEYKSLSKLIT